MSISPALDESSSTVSPSLSDADPAGLQATGAEVETRFCTGCYRHLPPTDFPIRYKATQQRHRTCRACFREYERNVRRPRNRRGKLSKSVTELASLENRKDARLLAEVVRRMMRHFGGLDRMCAEWAEQVKSLMERRPGCRLSMKTFQAIFYMAHAAAEAEQKANQSEWLDLAKLGDAELAELIGSMVK